MIIMVFGVKEGACAMGIAEEEITTRMAFVGLDKAADLAAVRECLAGGLAEFLEDFRRHLDGGDAIAAFPGEPDTQLKTAQKRYFQDLLAGIQDQASYVQSRCAIGLRIHHAGMSPAWYLGAFGMFVDWLSREIGRLAATPQEAAGLCAALFKIVLYDAGWGMEAYHQAAQAELRLYQKLFESNLEAVVIADERGRIDRVNRMFTTLTGYGAEEVGGRPLEMLLARPKRLAVIFRRAREGSGFRGETRLRRRDGGEFPVWLSAASVVEGERRHYVVEFSDISDYRRAQDELARRTEELKRSNEELEQFAYVASHDLQEPLRMVTSYTQLLARRYRNRLDDDARDFIHYAVEGATRMQALINDLLAFSRVGTQGKPFSPVAMEEALRAAVDNLQVAIAESGAQVSWDSLPMVRGDRGQLIRLLQNLLSNGIKFRREDPPRLHVGGRREAARWVFSVRDNGIGIEPRHFRRIFVIFQRLHRRGEYEGTGIGLALCKKIVERHGGRIWVESEPGKGSCFYFSLPIQQEEKER